MAVDPVEIAPATLSGTEGTFYTVGATNAKTKCLVLHIWLTNTHTASVTVSLYAVPVSGSIAVSNQIFADAINAKKNKALTIHVNLGENGTLRGLASTAGVVSMRIAPVED